MPSTIINVESCGCCGLPHENVSLNDFKVKRPPWSHWYTCPESGDPVPTFIATRNDRHVKGHPDLMDSIVQAEMAGSMLAVVFSRDGKELKMQRLTRSFNRDDFPKCIEMLEKDLSQDAGNAIKAVRPTELIEAPKPPPEVQLFGEPK